MNTVAWNCQGVGADLTKEHLDKLYHCFRPRFLFYRRQKTIVMFSKIYKFLMGMIKFVPLSLVDEAVA